MEASAYFWVQHPLVPVLATLPTWPQPWSSSLTSFLKKKNPSSSSLQAVPASILFSRRENLLSGVCVRVIKGYLLCCVCVRVHTYKERESFTYFACLQAPAMQQWTLTLHIYTPDHLSFLSSPPPLHLHLSNYHGTQT